MRLLLFTLCALVTLSLPSLAAPPYTEEEKMWIKRTEAQQEGLCPHRASDMLACIVAHKALVSRIRINAWRQLVFVSGLTAATLSSLRALATESRETKRSVIEGFHTARAQFTAPKSRNEWDVAAELHILVVDLHSQPIGTVHSVNADRSKVVVAFGELIPTRYAEFPTDEITLIYGYWNGLWKAFVARSPQEVAAMASRPHP